MVLSSTCCECWFFFLIKAIRRVFVQIRAQGAEALRPSGLIEKDILTGAEWTRGDGRPGSWGGPSPGAVPQYSIREWHPRATVGKVRTAARDLSVMGCTNSAEPSGGGSWSILARGREG